MACMRTGIAMFNKLLVFDFDCPVWLDKPSISDFPKSPPSKLIIPDIDLFLIGGCNVKKNPNLIVRIFKNLRS
jgi:hypothetical protein